jgi:hypothetical protein
MPEESISESPAQFGERVRVGRVELGMSHEQLAGDSSVHWSYLGQLGRGRRNLRYTACSSSLRYSRLIRRTWYVAY